MAQRVQSHGHISIVAVLVAAVLVVFEDSERSDVLNLEVTTAALAKAQTAGTTTGPVTGATTRINRGFARVGQSFSLRKLLA